MTDALSFLSWIDRLVPRNDSEVFMLGMQRMRRDGKGITVPAKRWPWGRSHPHSATHIDIALFDDQRDEHKARRAKKWRTRNWALMLDDVGEKTTSTCSLHPTYKIRTKPGSEQWVYVFDEPLESSVRMEQLVQGVINAGLTDPGARGTVRLSRLPGSQPTGKKHVAQIEEWNGVVYKPVELPERMGFPLPPARRVMDMGVFDPETMDKDPALHQLFELNLVRGETSGDGWIPVPCPWADEHSDDNDEAGYMPMTATSEARYHCFHGHSGAPGGSRDITTTDYLAWLRGAVWRQSFPLPPAIKK